MDAFETIAAQLLMADGYWVMRSLKVNLTKDEKKEIGKPTTPRPEIDIVAFDFEQNTLFLLEVKSFLDSSGVVLKSVTKTHKVQKGRYKLLTSGKYQKVVTSRLVKELKQKGQLDSKTRISYGLIAAKVYQNKESEMKEYFDSKNWFFWGPTDIRNRIKALAKTRYENDPVTLAAKLILRD